MMNFYKKMIPFWRKKDKKEIYVKPMLVDFLIEISFLPDSFAILAVKTNYSIVWEKMLNV